MINVRGGFKCRGLVAGAAGARAGNMGARFCARNHVVMTITARANHFVVIDFLGRRPSGNLVAGVATRCRLNMRICLAFRHGAVMAR